MRTKHTFSTFFWLQTTRAINEEALLYVRITVDGKRVNISLKKRVPITLWDKKKKKAKGSSPLARQINSYIEEVNTKLFQIYQDLKYQDQLITAKLIKAIYNGEDQNSKSLKDIFDYHSEKIKDTLAPGSIRNYGITQNYIFRFLEEKKHTTDIHLNKLNFEFLSQFELFLTKLWPTGHPKALSNNTRMKHIQRLRKVVTLAYHLEWIDRDPFIKWKMSYDKTTREFLSELELKNLEEKVFLSERLDRVRDLFVFSCYTGISYIDIMSLTPDNVVLNINGGNWIMTKRQKTNATVKVPLLDQALSIINKYKNHPITNISGSLLPVITNEKLNVYLKEVANFVGIHKNLTFHMARHTFATTVTLSNGVPIETVSKLLGHSKIATTQIYARVLEHKIGDDMNTLQNILRNKKSDNNSKAKRNN
ncbi:site-specific integrase [Oceanihabitans sediminis]|uniref:site-specific integrase n=1 Tax=Oceanihabitans sediminis TaxID=1812012 RepID=UPI00299D1810|nr:site-specific integrase [Oceanihabitans sediminis]MDX1774037.1 site-specific integrase [Oceanihabitans sediminis]